MKILTFDTSLDKTYVTLSDNEKILSDIIVENHNEKYHSAFLIPTIVSILKDNNLTMKDIDVIGTNIGPGSFTGIRACVTVARVIAQQLDCPLVGVSSLEILSHINKENKKTITILDARKKQYYTAVYENGVQLQEPALTNETDVLKTDFSGCVVISDSSTHNFLKENSIESLVYTDINDDLGVYLNKIVFNKIYNADKEEYLWGKLKPLYLQAPPVTISPKAKIS